MEIDRRQFVVLGMCLADGCRSEMGGVGSASRGIVDAGPASGYLRDGVYDRLREKGFFLIRRGGELHAMSSVCTHRKCDVSLQKDATFYCECHGSTFDVEGKVTKGPARRDLPRLPIVIDANGHVIVSM